MNHLAYDCWFHICEFLESSDVVAVHSVSWRMRIFCNDPRCWSRITCYENGVPLCQVPKWSFVHTVNMANHKYQGRNLDVLQHFSRLRTLDLSHTRLAQFSQIAEIPQLQTLILDYTKTVYCAEHSTPILPNLTSLSFVGGNLKPHCLTQQISQLTSLTTLNLSKSSFWGLEFLAPLRQLTDLDLSCTGRLVEYGVLRRLTKLRRLRYREFKDGVCTFLEDLPELRELDLSAACQIRDWTPLVRLTQLQVLNLSGSIQQTHLTHIGKLTSLQTLDLSACMISDVSPLASLRNLTYLSLYQNMELVNVDALAALVELRTLNLSLTNVVDIYCILQKTSKLRKLYLPSTILLDSSLSSVSCAFLQAASCQALKSNDLCHWTGLQHLNLYKARYFKDLSGLSHLFRLHVLNLEDTLVENLEPVQALYSLQSLNLCKTLVYDLEPLRGLHALQKLYLQNTPVRDVSPLARLYDLYHLNLNETNVSDVTPLSGLHRMKTLKLNHTHIQHLDCVRHMPKLRLLSCSHTSVRDLDPLQVCTQLRKLNIEFTRVSSLEPLREVVKLTDLRFAGTPTVVDMAMFTFHTDFRYLTFPKNPAHQNTGVLICTPSRGSLAVSNYAPLNYPEQVRITYVEN